MAATTAARPYLAKYSNRARRLESFARMLPSLDKKHASPTLASDAAGRRRRWLLPASACMARMARAHGPNGGCDLRAGWLLPDRPDRSVGRLAAALAYNMYELLRYFTKIS